MASVALMCLASAAIANAAGGAGLAGPTGGGSDPSAVTAPAPSGGAGLGGPAPTPASRKLAAGVRKHPAKNSSPVPPKGAKGRWIGGVNITEYWPAPESWFVGKLVSAPGLTGKHRIDWLYSAEGVSMEGDGYGLDGRMYHIDSLGDGGWVTKDGHSTDPGRGWPGGVPYWRSGGYWRTRRGAVTFPLQAGGWSNGAGRRYVPLRNVSFASGPSLPLRFLQSIAVDPKLIPLGSRVYIPAYRHDGHGGWFLAQDTGGAIKGRHVDVYRRPPVRPTDGGQDLVRQRIYVVRPSGR